MLTSHIMLPPFGFKLLVVGGGALEPCGIRPVLRAMNRSLNRYFISNIILVVLCLIIKFKLVGLVGIFNVCRRGWTLIRLIVDSIGRFE